MVEINAGDGPDLRVINRRSTENARVVANIRSSPITGEIERIGENRLLQSLKSYVSISNPLILKHQRRIDGYLLSSVTELISVVEKLPLLDVVNFLVSESAAAAGEGGILTETNSEQNGNEEN